MVRVVRPFPGGESVANNLEPNGHFGESAVLDGPAPVVRQAAVKVLCKTTLLRISREVLMELAGDEQYAWFIERLRREYRRTADRNQLFDAGWVLPPRQPPPPVADRLVLTRNLLLSDMRAPPAAELRNLTLAVHVPDPAESRTRLPDRELRDPAGSAPSPEGCNLHEPGCNLQPGPRSCSLRLSRSTCW
jgi:hypothetical protein